MIPKDDLASVFFRTADVKYLLSVVYMLVTLPKLRLLLVEN